LLLDSVNGYYGPFLDEIEDFLCLFADFGILLGDVLKITGRDVF